MKKKKKYVFFDKGKKKNIYHLRFTIFSFNELFVIFALDRRGGDAVTLEHRLLSILNRKFISIIEDIWGWKFM